MRKIYIKPSIESFEVDRLVVLSGLSPEPDPNENRFNGTVSAHDGNKSLRTSEIADRSLLSGDRPKF
ncbi:MAG: hypothetical protein MJZ13_02865 [Bacteroidales bacterium]|nr:hypothetical protein [Bacteroidales bacterium]